MKAAGVESELERMHPANFSWALWCCDHRRDEAEEVLQSAYLKVLEGSARFGGESSLKTWFFAVIRRTAAERRRRRWMRGQLLERWFIARPETTAKPDPESAACTSETSRVLLEALARLSARQREVLHLVFYQEMTIEEAAQVLHIPLGTARTHFQRGKRRLRQILADRERLEEIP
jgi:RNA polymerase sigma-70 factor (ECF subfamily)